MQRIRERLLEIGTGIMVVCAVTLTVLLIRREMHSTKAAAPERVSQATWTNLVSAGASRGPAGARTTIVEFSDFQCPACAGLHRDLAVLRARYPDRMRVIYRHLPLASIHPYAVAAARAAECANAEGAFDAFHDSVFANQPAIGVRAWGEFAAHAGVRDTTKFTRCMVENKFATRLANDSAAAATISAHSTPTLVVNGLVVRGRPSLDSLMGLLRE